MPTKSISNIGPWIGYGIRMPIYNLYKILATGFCMEIRMPTQNSYELLATGFHMEMRRIDMKYWPLDSVWK